MDLDDSKEEKC